MNVEALHITLQQSFSPDASLRDPAENQIRNLKHVNGSTVLLLQVAAEKQVCMTSHANTRQLSHFFDVYPTPIRSLATPLVDLQFIDLIRYCCPYLYFRSNSKFVKLLVFS